jgi:hypothetical protein
MKKLATLATLHLIGLLRGRAKADLWAWEMTPMPVGLPTRSQIGIGLMLAVGLDFGVEAYRAKKDREEEIVMNKWSKFNKQDA